MDFGDDLELSAPAQVAPQDNGFANGEDSFFGDAQVLDAAPAGPAAEAPPAAMDEALFAAEPAAAAPAPAAVLEADDPRRAWARKNAEVLAQRAAAEQAAKMDSLKKAQEHLAGFYEARKAQLLQRHSTVRSEASLRPEDITTPVGSTPWEKVTSVINFSFEHQRDMSKYRSILLGCKAKNTHVSCA